VHNKAGRFLIRTGLFLLPVLIFFEILFRAGYFPIITSSTLFDIKMFEVQKQHIKKVGILSIGSSINLYELNSDLIAKNINLSYYNFASWGLQITDMKNLLPGYIKEYEPKYVILCSSVGDFTSPQNDSYYNFINTGYWIKNNFPEFFYLKDYHSVYQIIRRKIKAYPLKLDNWGGATLEIKPEDLKNLPVNPNKLFPSAYAVKNYKALDSLAAFLNNQHIKLIFLQAPLRNSVADTSISQQALSAHFAQCRSLVEANGGVYLNYHDPKVFSDSLFIDYFHLQANGAALMTREVVADLRKIIK
jgi:hypothetical protein